MFYYSEIRDSVLDYLGEFAPDCDVDAIMDALWVLADEKYDYRRTDDFDYDTFLTVIENNA